MRAYDDRTGDRLYMPEAWHAKRAGWVQRLLDWIHSWTG